MKEYNSIPRFFDDQTLHGEQDANFSEEECKMLE